MLSYYNQLGIKRDHFEIESPFPEPNIKRVKLTPYGNNHTTASHQISSYNIIPNSNNNENHNTQIENRPRHQTSMLMTPSPSPSLYNRPIINNNNNKVSDNAIYSDEPYSEVEDYMMKGYYEANDVTNHYSVYDQTNEELTMQNNDCEMDLN
ncbi:hypothetical protein KAFR_0E00360 [Kazachstania africana CBS 2517]|uniref:Uncharacterized protein n=1 Tax=Kazachstania africana (strain ATCC 22294 / BCRC 22015 / CBS 2517 / CECT 1963 / NBRC 1671 / NRRL Y-8276) TaxID=1071382 RepID=H2AUZ0_KAZAF|nr:hypothetical protein KAFR_0E00360 [Kazachstania africana CBS 2517]CCF58190.1 hypothetical protein KAFR_0E00360 [Kazachstania africana CBS 2517]